jgi:putative salt-induced outer membrane protein YdiY
MQRILHAVLTGCLLLAVSAQADEVQLRNGDRLTGAIVQLTDGKLVLKSVAAGEVTIELGAVQTLGTDQPVQVVLKDGTSLSRRIRPAGAGQFAMEAEATLGERVFPLTDLTAINPPAKPAVKWSGSISAGATFTSGNTSAEAINASVSVVRRSEKDRITAGADYGRGRQRDPTTGDDVTTEDWWRAVAQYDYFLSKKLYGFVNGRYERDKIAELDRRVVLGGGAGYQWIESDRLNFSTRGGLASVYESFDNQTKSKSDISLQLGYNFDAQLNGSVKFLHDLTYFPSLEKFSDYYLTSTTELRATLTETMFANFKAIFDYDATPAIGRGSTDVKYIFGVGVTF